MLVSKLLHAYYLLEVNPYICVSLYPPDCTLSLHDLGPVLGTVGVSLIATPRAECVFHQLGEGVSEDRHSGNAWVLGQGE